MKNTPNNIVVGNETITIFLTTRWGPSRVIWFACKRLTMTWEMAFSCERTCIGFWNCFLSNSNSMAGRNASFYKKCDPRPEFYVPICIILNWLINQSITILKDFRRSMICNLRRTRRWRRIWLATKEWWPSFASAFRLAVVAIVFLISMPSLVVQVLTRDDDLSF